MANPMVESMQKGELFWPVLGAEPGKRRCSSPMKLSSSKQSDWSPEVEWGLGTASWKLQ